MAKKLILTRQQFADKFIKDNIHEYMGLFKITTAPIWIFDIHDTVVSKEGVDKRISKLIDFLVKKNHACLFLSYDEDDKKIEEVEKTLNNHSDIFKNSPKIFIKKKRRGIVLKYIYQTLLTSVKDKKMYMMIYVDDEDENIENIRKYCEKDVLLFQYLKHTSQKLDNLSELLDKPSVFYGF